MERLTLFCVITAGFTGLTSGVGLLPEDSVVAAVGGSVTFTTSQAPGQTHLHTIGWDVGIKNILMFLAGSTVIDPEYEGRVTLFTFTGSLELKNLTLSDTGEYSVNIRPTAGDGTIDGSTTLNVYEPVSNVTIRANSTDLVEFSSVRLFCSASGSSLSFHWFKDNVEVKASDRVHFTDEGATLTIVTVWRYDQGSYTCNVSNPFNNDTSDEEVLFVSYGPEDVVLTVSPSAEFYGEGSVVSLSCSADSRPPALIKWFINEQMLSNTEAQIDLVLEQSGNYSCQAFNNKTQQGPTSQTAEILVLKNITNGFVKSSNEPVEGSSVNLTCDAFGSIPIREWQINEAELKPSENIEFYDEKRVLSFRVLNRKDNGKYTCRISNPVSSQSVDYEMNVYYGPDSVQISDPGKVIVGKTLKLICSAESVPTANFTWTHNGTTVAQSHEFTKHKTVFSDSGKYICQATNDITMNSLNASRTVLVTDSTNPCPAGCIIGIVFGCIALILFVSGGVFLVLKKKKQKPNSSIRTDGEGRDNSSYAQSQEVNYADVRFVRKDGAVVQLGVQNNTEYSEVRRNNNPPPAARLPSYNAHMQRERRAAPEPPTEYAEVRPKRH